MSSNVVIVAIPDENDSVWKMSSEKVPHLTLLFLGDKVANFETVVQFVEHAATTTLNRFHLPIDRRGEFGADQADVLFFKRGWYDYKAVRDFRSALLQDTNIRTAYNSATQFEGSWVPHLTLGYPADPAKPDPEFGFYDVSFSKIAVWSGNFDGPEFLLKDYWDECDERSLENNAMDMSRAEVSHHGVKGQKWGVRKSDVGNAAKSGVKTVGRGVKKTGKGLVTLGKDVAFESEGQKQRKTKQVHRAATEKFTKHDLPRINSKYKGTQAETLKGRLKNPLNSDTRAYRSESRIAYRDRVNEAVNALPTNSSGNRKYDIEDGGKTNAQYGWTLKVVDVKKTVQHAEDVGLLDEFAVQPVFDADGFITDVRMVEPTLAQSTDFDSELDRKVDLGAEFLEHYGIRGMHWGQRKHKEVSAKGHVDSGLIKRTTKVRATGGEAHPAHDDAIVAAVQKQKLKKSGIAALSNQELRELQTRLQLEAQVEVLASKKGKNFVIKQLEEEGKNLTRQGIREGSKRATPHVIKRASKSAATAASVAALL